MHIDQDHAGLYDIICIDIMCIYVQYVYIHTYIYIHTSYLQYTSFGLKSLSLEVIPNNPKLGSSKGITSRPTQPTNSSGHGWENDVTPRANPNQLNDMGGS